MSYLTPCDRVVMQRAHLLGEAKREALYMADGYLPERVGMVYAAGSAARDVLLAHTEMLRAAGALTDYEAHMAGKLAYVLTGGVDAPAWVGEQVILDLEREAFLSLCGETKTHERIAYMLANNRALKN
jgi:3-hydroxyacyl-CoA dehydrogenase